jgi:hypothetical protein
MDGARSFHVGAKLVALNATYWNLAWQQILENYGTFVMVIIFVESKMTSGSSLWGKGKVREKGKVIPVLK